MTNTELIKKLRATLPLGPNISELLNAAADRLEELEKKRNEALAEGEQLKTHPTRPEPSRLEIAAMLLAHDWARRSVDDDLDLYFAKQALAAADTLIAAARGAK